MFDLSIPKLLVLAVIALVIFGPHELPKIASQAGRALRDLRKIAEGAKNDLREGLGPEFSDFDLEDLNPKRFVQKHLFDDMNGNSNPVTTSAAAAAGPGQRHAARPRRAPPLRPRRDLTRPPAAPSARSPAATTSPRRPIRPVGPVSAPSVPATSMRARRRTKPQRHGCHTHVV